MENLKEAMKNLITNSIEEVNKMTSRERMVKLCELSVKQELNQILPHEIMQLELIQEIRRNNGEINKVLKNWAENPELDPRIQ
jgi:hypothetical protein